MMSYIFSLVIESIIIGYAVNADFGGILQSFENIANIIDWFYNKRFCLIDQNIDLGWRFTCACLDGYIL